MLQTTTNAYEQIPNASDLWNYCPALGRPDYIQGLVSTEEALNPDKEGHVENSSLQADAPA